MSRRRAILAGVGGVVLIALMLQVALRHGTPTFQAGGAGLSAAPAAGNVAPRAATADSARGTSAPAAIEGQAAQALPSLDRMIVRNVSMTLVVANVVEAYHQIEQIALEQGGQVAGSQVRQEGDRTLATVTLRVPADGRAYQATLDRLRELADRVLDEQGQTQDVSEEYVDLESRLRNLRATEASLLALYEKAQRLEDVFAV